MSGRCKWLTALLTVNIQRQEEQVQIALEKVGQIVHFFAGTGELLKELQPLIKFDERILFFGGEEEEKEKMKFRLKRRIKLHS